MSWAGLALRLGARAVTQPSLAVDLVRVAWRFRPLDWWRRPPFLPIPDRQYVQWRMYTAYGDHHAVPSVDDAVRYARWTRHAP